MDATTLLYRFRATTIEDMPGKRRALASAFKTVRSLRPDLTFDEFIELSADVLARKYGGDAQDCYVTSSMSVVKMFNKNIDVYIASVINSIVIQMNFQTRIFLDGGQSIVFDGNSEYFYPAMLHGNGTQGICVTTCAEVERPEWVNAGPSIEVNCSQVYVLPSDRVTEYLNANGSKKLSALLMVELDFAGNAIDLAERYAYLAGRISPHTIFCLAGSAESIFSAMADMAARYPDIVVNLKVYSVRSGSGVHHKAIAIFSGMSEIPAIMLGPSLSLPCSFEHSVAADSSGSTRFVSYASGFAEGYESLDKGAVTGLWERSLVRKPFLLSSSAPLPDEAKERISAELDVYHSLMEIDGGMLIQSSDSSHAQFLYASDDGRVFNDYSDSPANTPLYRQAVVDENGLRRGRLTANRLVRVKGTAMPLMFTPTLHTWHSHFMIQCLPRVRIARDLGESITFLVPHDIRRKQLEMLRLLGAGEDRIAFIDRTDVVRADKLSVPCPWRLMFTPYSASIYDEIASRVEKFEGNTPKRMLISRESRKSWRNMINYDMVRDLLVDEFGFTVVAPERMSLAEEVATYANADVVVGAEGAGMYGAVFSRPGVKYLTLCDEDYVMPILGTIAEIRQLEIGYVFGESFRADTDVARRLLTGHADFTIDLGRVEKAVRRALAA